MMRTGWRSALPAIGFDLAKAALAYLALRPALPHLPRVVVWGGEYWQQQAAEWVRTKLAKGRHVGRVMNGQVKEVHDGKRAVSSTGLPEGRLGCGTAEGPVFGTTRGQG